ncbi:hypothetical protein ACET3Z_016082 [Daucus carota]
MFPSVNCFHGCEIPIQDSDTNFALGGELVLNGATDSDAAVTIITKRDIRGTRHMNMIPTRSEGSNFPSHPSIHLDHQQYIPAGLILAQRHPVVRRHRDVGAVDKRRPDVGVFVALVGGEDGGEVSDLLAPVGGEDVELVVVDSDFAVGVSGVDGDLEVGGEEVGDGGDVEGVDGGVLEGEAGLFGLENGPDDEEGEEADEEDDEEDGADAADDPLSAVFVVAALFCAHGEFWRGG